MAARPRRSAVLPRTLPLTAAITAATALVGSAASGRPTDSSWFARLRKPALQPPPVVFPIVWTALYTDIAVCSATTADRLADNVGPTARRNYLRALTANLVINASWSWVFFRAHRLAAAPLVAGLLAVSSADLVRRTAEVDRSVAAALLPYPVWCTFATVLSTEIWRRNRG
ncbi:TspO/MBR family protein [Rhodococcus sp. NPDC057014]|uniref:TspO/MBR family protein n=1 Tax=Rhodococcus sp. NPDC057014 TaxID=3346000 RepID=UPI00364369F5